MSGYKVPAVTWSTIGQANPSPVEQGRFYVWNGDPKKALAPDAPPEPLRGSPKKRAAEKAARYALFKKMREQEPPVEIPDCAAELNIVQHTAQAYERQRLKEAATIEAVKQAGREAWVIHQERGSA